MSELRRALNDINAIREQLAQTVQFRGYGPATVAATGILAALTAAVQAHWLKNLSPSNFVSLWASTAALALTMIGIETAPRCRQLHGNFSTPMLQAAIDQFLPCVVTGGLATVVILGFTPQSAGLLPGLWQLFFALGVFASHRILPKGTFMVGVWYLGCGLVNLSLVARGHAFSPWSMGIPFGIGQLMVADLLYRTDR